MTLRPGKLAPRLLAEVLSAIDAGDPRVIVGPGLGRDAAIIDTGGERLLVLKTDPITLADEHAGWLAVHVNANDIACVGGEPRWMMATLLLPPGADEALPAQIMGQMRDAARALGVTIVGGHTEVTLGIERPIVAAAVVGDAGRDEIITGEGVRDGDAIVLAGGAAVEGTAILARACARELTDAGVSRDAIDRACTLLTTPGISIVEDAKRIRRVTRPRLLHDATEGGVATALHEMAGAAAQELRVDPAGIPVLSETRIICDALSLHPLGLLASGALVGIIDSAAVAETQRAFEAAGRALAVIGTVKAGAPRAIMAVEGRETPLHRFERDELARYLDDRAARLRKPEGP